MGNVLSHSLPRDSGLICRPYSAGFHLCCTPQRPGPLPISFVWLLVDGPHLPNYIFYGLAFVLPEILIFSTRLLGQLTFTAAATGPADNFAASMRGEACAAALLQASHVGAMHRALQRLQERFPAARATMQLGGEVWEAPLGGAPPARLQPPAPWHHLPHVDSMAAALLPKHGAPLPAGTGDVWGRRRLLHARPRAQA